MKMLPTPDRRRDGSRWDHMIRMGRPLNVSKFIVSRARSAVEGGEGEEGGEGGEGERGGRKGRRGRG